MAAFEFKDLLAKHDIPAKETLVLRHRPKEPELRKAFPWLARDRPDIFNAYQTTHGPKAESAMKKAAHVAAFIGHEPGKAIFVALYRQCGFTPLEYQKVWATEAFQELTRLGMRGDTAPNLLFELERLDTLSNWSGRLIIRWPKPDRSWFRRPNDNPMPIDAILEEERLTPPMPDWREVDLTWAQLSVVPASWRAALQQWRGIYFIFDVARKAGYVGSACGEENLLGRWRNYAQTGHGGNTRLRKSKPENLRFSILELTAPNLSREQVVPIEMRWMERLHTRGYQLNDPGGKPG